MNMADSYNKQLIERRMRAQCAISWVDGSFTLFLVGVGCFMAAFIAPNWAAEGPGNTSGLWKKCYDTKCQSTVGLNAAGNNFTLIFCFRGLRLIHDSTRVSGLCFRLNSIYVIALFLF